MKKAGSTEFSKMLKSLQRRQRQLKQVKKREEHSGVSETCEYLRIARAKTKNTRQGTAGDEAGAVEPALRAKELGRGSGQQEPGSGFEHTIDCVRQTLEWNHR